MSHDADEMTQEPRRCIAARSCLLEQSGTAYGDDALIEQEFGAIAEPLSRAVANLEIRAFGRHRMVPDHGRKTYVDAGDRGADRRQPRSEPERGQRHRCMNADLPALGPAEQTDRRVGELLERLAH